MYAFTVTAHGSRSRLTVTVTRGVEGFVFSFLFPPPSSFFFDLGNGAITVFLDGL